MGNSSVIKCKRCETTLPTSETSREEQVNLKGTSILVKNHDHGQYYSISKKNILAKLDLYAKISCLGTLDNIEENTYFCWRCFWKIRTENERKGKQQRKSQREQRALQQSLNTEGG